MIRRIRKTLCVCGHPRMLHPDGGPCEHCHATVLESGRPCPTYRQVTPHMIEEYQTYLEGGPDPRD